MTEATGHDATRLANSRRRPKGSVLAIVHRSLPPGSLPLGSGLVATGLTAYGYLVLTARVLGPHRYVGLSVLWAAVFVAGQGLFLPLQQEVGRLFAHRFVERRGGGPVLIRAAAAGLLLTIALIALLAGFSGVIARRLFDGQALLVLGFGLALVGYLMLSLLWGALAGAGRFVPYASAQVGDASLRLALAGLLAALGVSSVGPYGLVLGLTPIIAAFVVFARNTDLLAPGPPAAWSDLSAALGWLLLGSLGAQLLMNGPVLAIRLLASRQEQSSAGHFLAGLVVSRVPLFLFGAVQATMLPQLATMAEVGKRREFRTTLARLLGLVTAIALGATICGAAFGPFVLRTFFGNQFALSRLDLILLTAASGECMLVMLVVQALVALGLHARSAAGCGIGLVAFSVTTAFAHSLFLRVEVGFLVGVSVALVVGLALLYGYRRTSVQEVGHG